MRVCPRLLSFQRDLFHSNGTAGVTWSVRELLSFSYNPGINEAFEGTWQSGDPLMGQGFHDASLDLGWLEEVDDELED